MRDPLLAAIDNDATRELSISTPIGHLACHSHAVYELLEILLGG